MSRVPHFLSPSPRNQWPQEHGLEQLSSGTSGHDIHSLGTQCTLILCYRMIAVHSKNQVIALSISGEIFVRVINDVVCTKRAHDVHIPRAAYGGDFGPKRFGNLHCKRTDTSRRTIDQHLLPLLNVSFIAKALQGGESRLRDGCCFLKRYIGRFQDQCIFRNSYIFGKTAKTRLDCVSEDLITCLKLFYISANCFNPSRNVRSEYRVFWFEKPIAHEAHQERFSSQEMPVTRIYGSRMNFYQDFIVLRDRLLNFFQFKNIG